MANKDIFKQAIAEAKSVREAAIANAKEALEESLTPHLKDMLAAKLQEMDEKEVDEEVTLAEEEVDEMKDDKKDESIDEMDHDKKDESFEVEEADEDAEDEADDAADDALDGMDDEAGEEPDGDEELGDLSVDDFKSLVRDIIAQEMGDGGEEMGADMDAGDLDAELPADDMGGEEGGEEEIDLDELLRELEATNEGDKKDDDTMEEKKDGKDDETMEEGEDKEIEEVSTANSTEVQDSANPEAQGTNVNRTVKEVAELELKLDAALNEAKEVNEQLETATETVETLRAELNEVNILNAKLLYVNKIFKNNDLNESQKVNVIAAFDKAETVKEVKLVYETVADNFITKEKEVKKVPTKKAAIKESKGLASKATGTTAKKPAAPVLNEVSDAVRRMQELAGIIN